MNKTIYFIFSFIFLTLSACAQKKGKDIIIEEAATNFTYEVVVPDLEIPWGLAWLPDGSMLITEKNGSLLHAKEGTTTTIKNVPKVYARGQGGLLDIVAHPDYATNGWIYFTYASAEGDNNGGHTALSRAKLKGDSLTDIELLYKATPNTSRGQHFGSRIQFDNKGYVYFSIGERGERDVNPQDINRDGGKIYRLNADGSIPDDNPFINTSGAKKAIYSYGHRNPQGLVQAEPKSRRSYGANPYRGYDTGTPFLYRGEKPPHGINPLERVVVIGEQAWPLSRFKSNSIVKEAGYTLTWSKGTASALDSGTIAKGRDVGAIRVKDLKGRDVVHDVSFAFAFHAFHPQGKWMLGQ